MSNFTAPLYVNASPDAYAEHAGNFAGRGEGSMSTGFVYMRPLVAVAARVCGPYASSSVEAWRQMFAWLDDSRMRREVGCGYGLLRDNPAEVPVGQCRYDACVELLPGYENTVPAGFRLMRLPGGSYARCRQVGTQGMSETIHALRDGWVPSRGLIVDPARPFIEVFLDDPDRVSEESWRIDLCIPVTRTAATGQRTAA